MKTIFQLWIMISLIASSNAWTAAAQTTGAAEAEKIKDEVAKHARLPIKTIKVRLKNGAELKGRPTEVEDETFVLLERKTGKQTRIKYMDVAKVKKTGYALSGTQKKLLIIGAVTTVLVLGAIFAPKGKPCDLRRLFC